VDTPGYIGYWVCKEAHRRSVNKLEFIMPRALTQMTLWPQQKLWMV
jgi:hypothetical protein